MKQKTRFKNFGNIGYRSMNGRYIGIGTSNAVSVGPYFARLPLGLFDHNSILSSL